MSPDELADAYRVLNASGRPKLVYHLTRRGFGSELNNMLLGILYALERGCRFTLNSQGWSSAWDQGWRDIFLPFCEEQPRTLFTLRDVGRSGIRQRTLGLLAKAMSPRTLLTPDVWSKMRNPAFAKQHFRFPELGIDGDIFHAKKVLLRMVYRLNETTAAEVEKRLPAIDKPYIALHVRRGDKLAKEAQAVPLESYIKKAMELDGDMRTLFVATDDYRVIEELRSRCEGIQLFTLCGEENRGYDNKNRGDIKDSRDQAFSLFADLHLLAGATHFIGTYSSNLSRLVPLLSNPARCHSMDRAWHAR